MSFVHLHNHTHYSLLDSTIQIPALISRVKDLGMDAVALTDHGNLFGAIEFYKEAKKEGIKPIIGCEVSHVSLDCEKHSDARHFSLVLLASNIQGYKNLLKVVSDAWMERAEQLHRAPIVSVERLSDHREGLVVLSGGLGGEIAQCLLRNETARAERVALRLREIFEEDFYLEAQPPVLAEMATVQRKVLELGEALEIPVVATNDVHYLRPEDAAAHRALLCIQLNKSVRNAGPVQVDGFHLTPPDEMRDAFADWPEACANTLRVAEKCDLEIPLNEVYLPQFVVPDDFDNQRDYLRNLAGKRLDARMVHLQEMGISFEESVYRDRLDYELGVIEEMGFSGYFLIVWDFIDWAKRNGVPVGPGRGSGAGSLVAYSLGITDINPMQYDLLFERFLNPERVSMPDFDIDFCMNNRDRVIRYVSEKYGEHNVGQIVTFGSLKARGVIRDVARVMDISYGEADRVAKLVPDVLNITLEEALEQEPRLRESMANDEEIASLITTARSLENLYRHTGVHAAGLVIGDEPLWNYVPILTGEDGEIISQYAKNEVEEAGLVKFDFLGLKTLTVIDQTVRLIRARQAPGDDPFDIAMIPMDDPDVFKLLQSGNTTGVFQLESKGFKDLMKRLKPDKFEDIIAAVALYRPGPLQSGMVDAFIRRKHGREPVDYLHPSLKEILEETYGTIVYQEQVMRLASTLAGFSLGQADILRRAMGKKKQKEMVEQRQVFVDGAVANEVSSETAAHIFDLVQEFASYGFNKSHSAAYGLISYQTAFLKAHYPVAFMAALLTCDKDNTDKVVRYIHEARSMNVRILPPDVMESDLDFSISDGSIRFGLGGVKNVGEGAIESIIEARNDGGAFRSLFDFCERVDLRRVNRRVVEGLVKCGAFDGLKTSRDMLFANIERAMERGQALQRDREVGQFNLFGGLEASTDAQERGSEYREIAPDDEWTERKILRFEREGLGFYITGHPLDRYVSDLQRYGNATTSTVGEAAPGAAITMGAVVASIRERPLRDGSGRMATLVLEDQLGQVEAVCFSREYAKCEELLKSEEPLLIEGNVRPEGEGENRTMRLRVGGAVSMLDSRRKNTKLVHVRVASQEATEDLILRIQEVFRRYPGDSFTALELMLEDGSQTSIQCEGQWRVDPSDELIAGIERLLGRGCVFLS